MRLVVAGTGSDGCLPSLPAQASPPNLALPCPVAVQRVFGEVDGQCFALTGLHSALCMVLLPPRPIKGLVT